MREALRFYTPERLAAWWNGLEAARGLALAAGREDCAARVGFLQVGVEYARLEMAAVQAALAVEQGTGSPAAALAAAQARDDFYRRELYNFTIFGPSLKWREVLQESIYGEFN